MQFMQRRLGLRHVSGMAVCLVHCWITLCARPARGSQGTELVASEVMAWTAAGTRYYFRVESLLPFCQGWACIKML